MEADLSVFGLEPQPGKIIVTRLFATWCPFCKSDLQRMAKLFKNGTWDPETVHVFLIAYQNHSENRSTFDGFRRDGIKSFGFPEGAVHLVYIDKTYPELVRSKNADGRLLFEGWKGVPFGLVFGKDQRLAFRGHFTMSDVSEDQHYAFITGLQKESCR
jgi:hypothetical protein